MIYFDQNEWEKLNQSKSPEEIMDLISARIVRNKIPFPYEVISNKQAIEDFEKLKENDPLFCVKKGKWETKMEYPGLKRMGYFLSRDNLGKKASNRFTQKVRLSTDHRLLKCGVRAWNEPESHRSMLAPLWTISKVKALTPDSLRRTIQLRKYAAAQFRPSAARGIYEMFGGGDVLDFSSGWGDRLVGALASPNVTSYTGVDPNDQLHPSYKKLVALLRPHAANKGINVKLLKNKAESVDYGKSMFDVVFTSPPYLRTEKYAGDDSSWRNFKNEEQWLNGFLFPAISEAYHHLRNGGFMIINIADLFNRGSRFVLCKPMVDYVRKELGGTFEGQIGYEMSKTIGRHVSRPDGTYCEPMFVFRKV